MKIILTVHQFFPDYTTGTEVLTLETAKQLVSRGHQVTVWTMKNTDEDTFIDEYEYQGVRVKRYNINYSRFIIPQNKSLSDHEYINPDFEKYFVKFLEEEKPDIVHCFHLLRLSTSVITAARRMAIPIFFTTTDFWFICMSYQLKLPDHSVCEGPDMIGGNCIKHMISLFARGHLSRLISMLPDFMFIPIGWLCATGVLNFIPNAYRVGTIACRKKYMKRMINLFDRVFVPTSLMKEKMEEFGLDPSKIRKQPFGINLDYIDESHLTKTERDHVCFGFIGSLNEPKGAHIAIKAIRSLPSNLDVRLKIYGREIDFPDYCEHLRSLASGDERIEFMDTFPNTAIGEIFQGIDALIVPSLWHENTPLVVYSAQSTKTPVIASNLGGLTEVIRHEDNGLLFEKGDVEGLASLMIKIINDREILKRLSKNARKPKGIAQYVDEIEHEYLSILSEKE
jgi:glycosyltransferase involved in cell wall biosynthesis